MPWDFGSVGSGATSGAATGMAAGPWGALIGGVAGGVMGGFSKKPKSPFGDIESLIRDRQSQILAFSDKLEQARNSVLANYNNLQTKTMARFTPALEASLAGRGLSVNGGAFNSGVGAEAAGLESQYDMLNTNLTERNLNTIGQMQSDLFDTRFGLAENKAGLNYAQNQSTAGSQASMFQKALGPLSNAAGGALRNYFGSPGTPTGSGFNINPAGTGSGSGMWR